MSTFADSSALVKLYVPEEGSESVRGLVDLVVSQICRVEVPSAFWRKQRLGEIGVEHAATLAAAFEVDLWGSGEEPERFVVVRIDGRVLDRAARLCAQHGLRAYDAVQLASALLVRAVDPGCSAVAAFDVALRAAAGAEGFDLVPEAAPTRP